MTRIIKRYANRKLYDTHQSSYVTLDEIQKMVEKGEDLRIIDNKTKEDITNPTLAQIIFEQEKSKKKMLPLSALRSIIQSTGEDIIQKLQNPVIQVKEELKHRSMKLEEGGRALRDFVEATQTSLDEMQFKIDERLKDAVDQMTHVPNIKDEMNALDQRLTEVETSLKRIELLLKSTQRVRSGISSDPREYLPK